MIGKNFIFDGNAIPYTAAEGMAANWLADFVWTNVRTRNITVPRQNYHGAISAPTFTEGRLIEVNGQIFNTNKVTRGSVRDTIQSIFAIENVPTTETEFKTLDFTDDDGTEWFLTCKVFTMPEYENERGSPIVPFFLQLYAQDPVIKSKVLYEENGIYGLLGGVQLPTELPIALNDAINSVSVTNLGTFDSAPVITIEGDITNPKVVNLTTGQGFGIDVDMNAGDTLVLDTENLTAELNGINVLADRTSGSQWVFIQSGANELVLIGDDFDFNDQSKATIKIEYRYAKI